MGRCVSIVTICGLCLAVEVACDDDTPEGDGDSDVDADADTDVDADSATDGDADGDTDADPDGTPDGEPDGTAGGVSLVIDAYEKRIRFGSAAASTNHIYAIVDLTASNAAGQEPAPIGYTSFRVATASEPEVRPWPGSVNLEPSCAADGTLDGGASFSCQIAFEILEAEDPLRLSWGDEDSGRSATMAFSGNPTPVPFCEELGPTDSGDCYTCMDQTCQTERDALRGLGCGNACEACATAEDPCTCVETSCSGECATVGETFLQCFISECVRYC